MRTLEVYFFLVVLLLAPRVGATAPTAGYKVVARYPHSTESYTEGFFYRDGLFYEGTGLNGHSSVLAVEPETGKVVQRLDLPAKYFGEGIVDWGANLYEWTWTSHTCFVYDRFSLRLVRQFSYDGEGWGMTRSAREIITSDGTSVLRFRDPATFRETHHITVHDGKQPVERLNELEWIKARSTPMSGTQTGLRASRRQTGESLAGSTLGTAAGRPDGERGIGAERDCVRRAA